MWLSSDDMVNQYIFSAITLAFVGAIGLPFSLGHLWGDQRAGNTRAIIPA